MMFLLIHKSSESLYLLYQSKVWVCMGTICFKDFLFPYVLNKSKNVNVIRNIVK